MNMFNKKTETKAKKAQPEKGKANKVQKETDFKTGGSPFRHRAEAFLKGETCHFTFGLLAVIMGVYLLLAFSSFFFTGGNDQDLLSHPQPGELMETGNRIQNYAGARGAQLAQFFINECFGIPAFFIIIFLIVLGMKLMNAYQFRVWKWFLSCSLLMAWSSIALAFLFGGLAGNTFLYPGGLHGYNVTQWLASQIGQLGVGLVLLASAILLGTYFTRETMGFVRTVLHPNLRKSAPAAPSPEETTVSTDTPQPAPTAEKDASNSLTDDSILTSAVTETVNIDADTPNERDAHQEDKESEESHTFELPLDDEPDSIKKQTDCEVPTETADLEKKKVATSAERTSKEEPAFEISASAPEETEDRRGELDQPYNPRLDLENYHFPTLDLLKTYEDNSPDIDMQEQTANKNRIIQVLRSFGIEISSIKASVGPTITLYEITPAEGVRISKIRNLEDDIALSLSALGIRIIAPIPGKGTIGIEVPNANPRIVPMSSVLASKKFQETSFELPVVLGKTITNEVFMVDLAKAPHMLVAGATGQGKSVGLNAIVTSLLYKKHPSELKFVIIDPKKVEFAIYAPIERHFLAKLPDGEDAIITDVTKVVQTLNSLCVEMDTRYDLLRKAGCRNIKEYNAKFIARQLNPEHGHRFLPYIVIIIDEFGDLIMTAGKEVELPICRIAQLARAVGIHAIIATQRPTTNIITGTIKANFPARVAFRVASMMDSRTILDRPGAQQLIGKGDLLYLQGSDPVRVQCAFVDTPEVERIANFISHQQGYPTAFMLPEYVDPNADPDGGAADVDMNRLDPLFEEAARLLIYHQQGSTSLIQRKFSIGYNRAGRIMDQLEKAGIVGPTNGSKARDVLCMDENDLENRLSNLMK